MVVSHQEHPDTRPAMIDLHNVTVYRGSTPALEGLTLTIREGSHTVVLGPNGAGKTTLMKLLSCELYPVYHINTYAKVFGKDRWNVEDLRSQLGIISHDLQQDYLPDTSGINVILSGYYASIDIWKHQEFSEDARTHAETIMEYLGVGDLKNRAFGSMSTGQQRRLLLGRALVNNPRALLLDEPTAGLDPRASFQYLAAIRTLMESGKTVILVTHHIHEIPPEINRVVLLKAGKIIADGSKTEVLTTKNLATLFDYPLRMIAENGWYHVIPDS
ncbi:MAG: ATP-binding cassette domain-containing protein [Chlorobiaceae bacterium]|jgi:iron complex transport system ATP-binding protein|nr:ATP-binding cassette domain-containing protein [Chlorobiaceae bacterium]